MPIRMEQAERAKSKPRVKGDTGMNNPIKFGKYYLLERINVGGMAEVFRAKAYGVEGFERLVAVKRILPNIAEDKEFIRMFVDEAKISVQLTHANIAQVFDLGVEDGAYYIALEHVHGRDARAVFDRAKRLGQIMPVAQACFIAMKVCEALDYAHNKRDNSGTELNLIHRDVSPQNIIVSFEGEVKIIDFGIAKAAGKGSKTQAGILKGKFGYMSPEQVRGLPIDRRSDVFSCGIVLYEMLTGSRLFVGESDFSTLEKVRNVEVVPPSTYNKSIQPELERIVLKALAKDVSSRYASAIDLHDDLQAFIYTASEFYSRKDLAGWMKSAFANEIKTEIAKLEHFQRMSEPLNPASKHLGAPENQGIGKSKKYPTQPPPLPQYSASRGSAGRAKGTLPPALPYSSQTSNPQGLAGEQGHSNVAAGLAWDDDELETSIYDDEKNPSLPGVSESVILDGAYNAQAGPDLSEIDSRGRDAQEHSWQNGPTFEPLPLDAEGSDTAIDPKTPQERKPPIVEPFSFAKSKEGQRRLNRSGHRTESFGNSSKNKAWLLFLATASFLILLGVLASVFLKNKMVLGNNENADFKDVEASQNLAANSGQTETGLILRLNPQGLKAEAFLDGKLLGKTPLKATNLKPGPHKLSIEAPNGYFNKTEEIQIAEGQVTDLELKLDVLEVMATFDSQPSGASVILVQDGNRLALGRSPISYKLDPTKTYQVVFEDGKKDSGLIPVTFNGSSKVDVSGVKLKKKTNRNPNQIYSYRDSEKLERKRVNRRQRSQRSSEEDQSSVESDAVTGNGLLNVGSRPPCNIYIDGRDTGFSTPKRKIPLSGGKHRVTLVNLEHGIKETFEVLIKPGETTPTIKDFRDQIVGQ